jgi:thiamine biosynthesis lipoprotein
MTESHVGKTLPALALFAGWIVAFTGSACDKAGKQKPVEEKPGGPAALLKQPRPPRDHRIYVETRTYMSTVYRLIVALPVGTMRAQRNPPPGRSGSGRVRSAPLKGAPLKPAPQTGPEERIRDQARIACRRAFDEVARVERLMSSYLPTSEVSAINAASAAAAKAGQAAMKPVTVGPDTFRVLQEAQEISRLSKGAFDITFAAMKGLWRFKGPKPLVPPKRADVLKRLSLINFKNLTLDERDSKVSLKPGMRIGLGGIAKGYALDRAAQVLKENGFTNFIVYGGGDLVVSGRHPERAWRIGIQDPDRPGRYFAVINATDVAVVTSGDYERYFTHKGKRYHHIINPRTGFPAVGIRAVTVVTKRALYADGLCTALFVMGIPLGKNLAERLSGVEALFVPAKGPVTVTSGLRDQVEFIKAPKPKPAK